ncbi:MAG: chemotaxis protein CheA [Herbinix sp.]|nr:chemotaxis protein CheA [Herbinix sp.]
MNELSERFLNDPMLDMYLFETNQNIEQLEQSILSSEKHSVLTIEDVNDIFRVMHTIKGSSAMMLFNNIASMAHALEDLFYFLREEKPTHLNYSILSDLVLEGIDFIKIELIKITNMGSCDGDASSLIERIKSYLASIRKDNFKESAIKRDLTSSMQQYYLTHEISVSNTSMKGYKATFHFDPGCEMENLRAYNIVHNVKEITEEFYYVPSDIIENDDSILTIREKGFQLYLKTVITKQEVYDFFMKTLFLKSLEVVELGEDVDFSQPYGVSSFALDQPVKVPNLIGGLEENKEVDNPHTQQNIISVQVAKLDKLMDLMGEMVIAEAMVTQNPDLHDLRLENFHKAARQLRKITNEVQDMVMSIRMVPLSATFHKMHRIVRDMSKKLNKEVQLKLLGEETEVDKKIIEHISDPLMHLVRNSIDHGIGTVEERRLKGKTSYGLITLEAKNSGSDVIISIKDDGKGLNKERILDKARDNGILTKAVGDMTDRDIFNLIFLPGFSTKDDVSEFSGRGVGMDVVIKNIEAVGGSISVDSKEDVGTTTILKIPLTLAIIDGMNISVGAARYTLPTNSIKESFRPNENQIIIDPDGNEMIMVRGQCYPILRLHKLYGVETTITDISKGILIMVEQDGKSVCLLADELKGQQQVVVKALPNYIRKTKKIDGLAGCTLLGDGSISLILNISGLLGMKA